jgi:hypothetical protein
LDSEFNDNDRLAYHSGDDHDVLDEGQVIGRIVWHPQASNEAPRFWAVTA